MVTVTVRRFGVSVTEKRTHLSLTTYQRLDLERRMPSYVRTRTQAHTHARWLLQRTRPELFYDCLLPAVAAAQAVTPMHLYFPLLIHLHLLFSSSSSLLLSVCRMFRLK